MNEAVAERTKFLDDNMHLFAEFQIGDHLKNVTGGEGVCVGHYRCQAKSFEFDTSFKVDSKIRWIDRFSSEKPEDWKNFNWQDLKGGSIDNTSHYGYENPWFKVGDKKAEQEKLKNFAERRNY